MDILIVEDEPDIAELIEQSLEEEGFCCRICHDGFSALEAVRTSPPDLIVLDLRLPGLDGLEVCARIRQQHIPKDPYILMLTARGEEIDRIIGLSTGADDYFVKPFSPRELIARVRALLRRSLRHGGESQVYRSASFTVDVDRHVAHRHYHHEPASVLDLTHLEFKLLTLFVKHPRRVCDRAQLIEYLWGDNFFGNERVIDTHIARLRKKIEPDPRQPRFIKTVVGVGYKFEDDTPSSLN
ncbi:response regulator transcription factor [Oxynema sp. CENA135]|uniref:response regulator transcription factor n=1 Tax=Oxynema sp. CENA135 TaxID=984206 RepID=UPI00190A3D6A|nr:response regulator transcription factor [Oxynema sp. CENA135]MBK4732029.1 response regulator transcription factor [Oxynema sp. CENA135]